MGLKYLEFSKTDRTIQFYTQKLVDMLSQYGGIPSLFINFGAFFTQIRPNDSAGVQI